MPGFNTIINLNKDTVIEDFRLSAILESLRYDPSYNTQNLYASSDIEITSTAYKEYPHAVLREGDVTLLVDGAIYNLSLRDLKARLDRILPPMTGRTVMDLEPLAELVLSLDGEFMVYYIDNRAGILYAFNDALGRLPYYAYAGDNRFLLSRRMSFITKNLPQLEFDRDGICEYLLFSTPLGNRTFIRGVWRVLPATLFTVHFRKKEFACNRLYIHNLDERHDGLRPQQHAEALHDLFLQSVRWRMEKFADRLPIVALSGGLDSRAVLLALLKCGFDVQCITFRDAYAHLGRDLPVVKALVDNLGVRHRFFDMPEDNIRMMEKLILGKDGMGLMGLMGSVLYSMEIIEREFGKNIVYFTGDEGNYIVAPRYAGGHVGSTPALVKTIMSHNSLSVFDIKEAARILGKSPADIMAHLCDYFDTYPEKDNLHRIDRYFIFERSFKFTMENQDRIRLYYWPLAPHYGIRYAHYAFKIPNTSLADWKVYLHLLRMLDPRGVKVKYANFGLPLDSPLLSFYLPLRRLALSNEKIRRNLIRVLRLLRHPTSINNRLRENKSKAELKRYFKSLTAEQRTLGNLLDFKYLSNLVEQEDYIFRLYMIINLTKYLGTIGNKSINQEAAAL